MSLPDLLDRALWLQLVPLLVGVACGTLNLVYAQSRGRWRAGTGCLWTVVAVALAVAGLTGEVWAGLGACVAVTALLQWWISRLPRGTSNLPRHEASDD